MKPVAHGAEPEPGEPQQTRLPACGYRDVRVEGYGECDQLIAGLGASPPDRIAVTGNGAVWGRDRRPPSLRSRAGGAVFRRQRFAVRSYRLGCAYFHEKPLATERLSAAFAQCV